MAIKTNSLTAWVLASRPKTLGAISCPIIIGNALAYFNGHFSLHYFLLIFLCGIALQILSNVVNDYGDFVKGNDKTGRLGPPRAMQMGFITTKAMLIGIKTLFLIATTLGLFLVNAGGPIILVLGLFAIILCFAYTLGPVPLAYFGFVEIIIFLVFGPMIVLGSYFVQTRTITIDAIVASFSPGFLSAALLLTNNLRDVILDRESNKRTIAVRFGEKYARILIIIFLLCSLISLFILAFGFNVPKTVLLAAFAHVLPGRYLSMIFYEPISARFNLMFVAIGQALFLFGIFFAFGILYGGA